jgi:signal transduction histidine kinase
MLMERERLASLGQLIGGIAHNLKTPIMSISGAAEGLSDLVKEYDSSIDDPDVNSQDHHDIAKDMNSWIVKIKDYTEYMSDIITTVKGQAVNLSNEEDISFTIEELLKRVNILMKHELKNAIIYLNISLKTDENTIIHGDVNSLVQVINNMVSNSIQAYEGKTEQTIDLIVEKEDNNLLISIKDYASGLPDKVKEKLFKEMITTKGKNGTGLGLYMSYSTIKAHFNGNITVDSELGKGTTFTITLPLQ